MTKKRGLQLHVETGSFEAFVALALGQISKNWNTLDAYWRDVRRWLDFCARHNIDPHKPRRQEVSLWMDEMREAGVQAKTRTRRISSLCSVYRELRRELTDKHGKEIAPVVLVKNPFSVDDGPRRERGNARRPTPVARPDVVQKLLATCDASPLGVRDRALIRILWATGIRRSSACAMTIDALEEDRDGYQLDVEAKGAKNVRILVRGTAATDLAAWLETLRAAGITKGPLWRTKRAQLTERGIWWMLRTRADRAKVSGRLSPHMLRVAFLTFNRAGLEAKQEAAGHADPATTRMYDRTAWRGREAFEQMPEVEEVPR
jgi:integrase/recombinase XerD